MWKHSLSHFYFLIYLRFIHCCVCNANYHDHGNSKANHAQKNLEKRQLELDDFSTPDYIDNSIDNSTDTSAFETTTVSYSHTSSEIIKTIAESNENIIESTTENEKYTETNDVTSQDSTEISAEMNETNIETSEISTESLESSTLTTTTVKETTPVVVNEPRKQKKIKHKENRDVSKKCLHFKKGTAFNLVEMVDDWQVAYYRLPNKLKCFELHIKLVESKEQERYSKVYGSFNDTVHWDQCNLEIQTSEKNEGNMTRRHFLQGTQNEKGVMDNIIIDEEYCQNTTYLTLHRETPDQWLVMKNLLLMRDCVTRDIVVFIRVPLEPRRDEIMDALMIFGENKPNGTMACEEKHG